MNSLAPQDTSDALIREIDADADAECRRLLESARSETAVHLAAARTEAVQEQQRRLAEAHDEAEHLAVTLRATIPLEERRLRASRIESLLESLRRRIQRALRTEAAARPRAHALHLAAEAIRHMDGTAFRLRGAVTARLGPESEVGEELSRLSGRSRLTIQIVADPSLAPGDVVVEDLASRRHADQSLDARLERLWPELRARIARVPGLFVDPTSSPSPSRSRPPTTS